MLDIGDEKIDDTMNHKFEFLSSLGFDVVYHENVNKDNIAEHVKAFSDKIAGIMPSETYTNLDF